MPQAIRRIVTGHDAGGRSVFLSDGAATNVMEVESMPGLAVTDLWKTHGSPASNAGDEDTGVGPVVLEPPQSGTIFRMVEVPPDSAWQGRTDGREVFESIGAGHASDAASDNPMMHKTSTVDYLVVVRGEIWAVLEEGEVCLRPGDVMVQRGTNHAWSVRTEEPCLMAAILVDADPV